MKAVVAAFNQEKALVGAFSVITNLRMELFETLISGDTTSLINRFAALQEILDRGTRHTADQLVARGSLYDMIQEDNHVYIEWLSSLEMLAEEQYKLTRTCDYAFSRENFFYEHVAMAFPDDSPWIKKFNHEIRLMLQSGLMLKWKKVRPTKI